MVARARTCPVRLQVAGPSDLYERRSHPHPLSSQIGHERVQQWVSLSTQQMHGSEAVEVATALQVLLPGS